MDIDGLDSFSKILFAERPINNKLVSSLFFHLLGIMLNASSNFGLFLFDIFNLTQ
jgi:hypothetical protein